MKTVLVRYRVRDEMASTNEALIHGVFEALRQVAPPGLEYHVYRLPDRSSFVHLARIDTPDGSNPLVSLEAFARFQHSLRERCVELPVATDLTPIDGYVAVAAD